MAHLTDPSVSDPMLPTLAKVVSRTDEVPGVVTFAIEAEGWTGFAPGQFNMLSLFGVGEIAISLSGNPDKTSEIVHTIRDVGPVSGALTELQPKEVLGLRGPYGAGWPVDAAKGRDVIVAAGGLGLAPVRPILYHLLNHRDRYGKVTLIYGARSPSDILFRSELSAWRARLDLGVEVTVDHAAADWYGHVGVVTELIRGADFDPNNTTSFVCGPEIMMRFTANALTDMGLTPNSIYMSMERNMQCAIGLCGHCQLGSVFVCKDGPVFDWQTLQPLMTVKEL